MVVGVEVVVEVVVGVETEVVVVVVVVVLEVVVLVVVVVEVVVDELLQAASTSAVTKIRPRIIIIPFFISPSPLKIINHININIFCFRFQAEESSFY